MDDEKTIQIFANDRAIAAADKIARTRRRGKVNWLILLALALVPLGIAIYGNGYMDGKASLRDSP